MGTVKGTTNFGIDERLERLRLQVVITEMGRRIGSRIRQRRTELGLTQKQVAKLIREDFDKQRLSDWERGANIPNEANFAALVIALEVPDVSYFYEEPEEPDLMEAFSADSNGQPGDLAGQLKKVDERLAAIERSLETIATARAVVVSRRTLQQLLRELPGEGHQQTG